MAKKRKLKFKSEWLRSQKISIYNKALGRHIKVSNEQVLSMAEGGRLSKSQMKAMFETEAPAKKADKEEPKF